MKEDGVILDKFIFADEIEKLKKDEGKPKQKKKEADNGKRKNDIHGQQRSRT